MQALAPLTSRYLPWSKMSMRPSAIVTILNEIMLTRPTRIVECGAGLSTFYIAQLLGAQGGTLVSVEHDPRWAALTRRLLEAEGLEGHVSMIVAPLADTELSVDGSRWYAEQELGPVARVGALDMLIVDGPPAHEEGSRMARYPALPFFAPYLAEDSTIVLDDIRRRGEQEVLTRWESELGVEFERRFADGGIGLSRGGRGYEV
jgi:predicted O-methyltransferase YrrM